MLVVVPLGSMAIGEHILLDWLEQEASRIFFPGSW